MYIAKTNLYIDAFILLAQFAQIPDSTLFCICNSLIVQGPLKQMDGIATKCSFRQRTLGRMAFRKIEDIITKFK